MAQCADFFELAFGVAANGVLPSLKLVQSLQKLHGENPIFFNKQPLSAWAPDAGSKLRMMAAHYRSLIMNEVCQRRCFLQALGDIK